MLYARVVGGGVLLLLAGLACTRARIAEFDVAGLGAPCSDATLCREPLVCAPSGTCEPSGSVEQGGQCWIDLDCAEGLYCAAGSCAPAGDGEQGAFCESSADCLRNLRCSFAGLGGVCTEGGNAYVDEACATSTDCMAGLLCDPSIGVCQSILSPPGGELCNPDSPVDCAPALGIVCLPNGVCGGAGPDGQSIPPWSGANCPDVGEGAFRVHFELNNTSSDFYRLPFPNEARRQQNGQISMAGFPIPSTASVPFNIVERFVSAHGEIDDGFGPHQAVFFRFSHAPKFCGAHCGGEPDTAPCWRECMGSLEEEQSGSLYVVDITKDDDGDFPAAPFTPVTFTWRASTASRPYVCGPWLALSPASFTPWVPGRTYAVFIHNSVKSRDGASMTQDADLLAMLSDTAPGPGTPERRAWDAYAPLREWLETAPVFPAPPRGTDINEGDVVTKDMLGGATVFTVRDPTTLWEALADAVAASPLPTTSDVAVCQSTDEWTCASANFTEVHGSVALPQFQGGELPFELSGGNIEVGAGGAVELKGDLSVRFALSIPDGSPPVGGWPVVIYAHGTGGDFRSHIEEGLAAALAAMDIEGAAEPIGFAVLGIDQVAHGPRGGDSALDSEFLFFNILNPAAAKGNVLQGAADQLSLIRALPAISAALPAGELNSTAVALLGHSQGAIQHALAATRAAGVTVVGLSGVGGGLLDSLTQKTSPYELLPILQYATADFTISPDNGRVHPVLNVVQGVLDDVDPLNFAAHLHRAPFAGQPPKHVLHVVGVGDTYTPNATAIAYARRLGSGFVDDDDSGLVPPGSSIAEPPVKANIGNETVVTSIHEPDTGNDGHFVLFHSEQASERMRQFFGTWFADAPASVSDKVPTVVE